jgi:hypothetical protein
VKRFLVAALVTGFVACHGNPARADEKEAKAVIDKAIKAAGGEEKLAKARVLTWKTKGTITINGNDGQVTGTTTTEGLDHYRAEFEADLNGNTVKGVIVLNGDKGWRKFGEETTEMDADALANEKRSAYLQFATALLVPLNGKGFKIESAADEKVGDKPASVVKATGPDGKDFTVYFDKESSLPVKLVAKMIDFQGNEFTQESKYSDYKDFNGIKKATKVETKHDGERFIDGEVIEFKVLDKAGPDTFTEPKS